RGSGCRDECAARRCRRTAGGDRSMSVRMPEYLEALRDALVRAHRTRTPVDAAALPVPRGDADAYAVQRALAADLRWFGTRPAAWKVGSASRNATPSAAPI